MQIKITFTKDSRATPTGLEPARRNSNRFRICRLNHSATVSLALISIRIILYTIIIPFKYFITSNAYIFHYLSVVSKITTVMPQKIRRSSNKR
jgi:hypothetical protein